MNSCWYGPTTQITHCDRTAAKHKVCCTCSCSAIGYYRYLYSDCAVVALPVHSCEQQTTRDQQVESLLSHLALNPGVTAESCHTPHSARPITAAAATSKKAPGPTSVLPYISLQDSVGSSNDGNHKTICSRGAAVSNCSQR